MVINAHHFLLSLATAVTAICNADGTGAGTVAMGTNLFVGQATENVATFAVLRAYGGPAADLFVAVPEISVQAMTLAQSLASGHLLAGRLYAALFTDGIGGEVQPRYGWTFQAKKFDANGNTVDDGTSTYTVQLVQPRQSPGQIGIDSAGRHQIVFNFDIRFQMNS